jgi:hypothetical protein
VMSASQHHSLHCRTRNSPHPSNRNHRPSRRRCCCSACSTSSWCVACSASC